MLTVSHLSAKMTGIRCYRLLLNFKNRFAESFRHTFTQFLVCFSTEWTIVLIWRLIPHCRYMCRQANNLMMVTKLHFLKWMRSWVVKIIGCDYVSDLSQGGDPLSLMNYWVV